MTSTDQWMSVVDRITRERDALAREIASLRAALEAADEAKTRLVWRAARAEEALEAAERERDEAHELARKCLFEDAEYAWIGEINKALNAAHTRLVAERDALKERAETAEANEKAARALLAQPTLNAKTMRDNQELHRQADALKEQVEAARALWDYMENGRQTWEPPRDLLDQGFVALETSEDYDKLEQLTDALGAALARLDQRETE